MNSGEPLILVTRGSPLALAQTNMVVASIRTQFPDLRVETRILRTTGDKLQKAALAQTNPALPKGLFTKELETALLDGSADLAVHSLKDLPTDLPDGLTLGAVLPRADARDVLLYRAAGHDGKRGFAPHLRLADLPDGATVATSSTRRHEQLLAARPGLHIVGIRGNVGTRLNKLATQPDLDATLLAAAGLARLGFRIADDGTLSGPTPDAVPPGLLASPLDFDAMLPCVGQAAIGLEIRDHDARLLELCARLNDPNTFCCVTAERAFLRALGGGCQSPVAAYATVSDRTLHVRAVSFRVQPARRGENQGTPDQAESLGQALAARLGEVKVVATREGAM